MATVRWAGRQFHNQPEESHTHRFLADLWEEVAAQSEGNERLSRELTLLRRLRRHALALPQDLVRQFATAKSQSLGAWEEARAKDAYELFSPSFDRLLALVRERAQAALRACRAGRRVPRSWQRSTHVSTLLYMRLSVLRS